MSIIKSFAVGDGDMFYIKQAGSLTIIDCNMNSQNRERITDELVYERGKGRIIRFISTHPDEDHFRGLAYLFNAMKIPLANFYCVENQVNKDYDKGNEIFLDFMKYWDLRDFGEACYLDNGLERRWLNESGDGREGAGFEILWPDITNGYYRKALINANNGGNTNYICPIIRCSLKEGIAAMWFGDLQTDFMEEIDGEVNLSHADIIFAPHHGRTSGRLPDKWFKTISPKLIVIGNTPRGQVDPSYRNPTICIIKQNDAGDVALNCDNQKIDIYVSNDKYQAPGNFLRKNVYVPSKLHDCSYIGTLLV